ncbi:MAG: hypothetical protein OXF84_11310 [Bacteroidetes bacterium]|nr:hypothetical protein [Bacteroidota bacterium]
MKKKGFVEDLSGHHISYSYDMPDGTITTIKTYVSHGKGSQDIDHTLISLMARQVKLSNKNFKRLISCDMDLNEYAEIIKESR